MTEKESSISAHHVIPLPKSSSVWDTWLEQQRRSYLRGARETQMRIHQYYYQGASEVYKMWCFDTDLKYGPQQIHKSLLFKQV